MATSNVVARVTEKVRDLAPTSTSRWTDAQIRQMIHAADCLVQEYAETRTTSYDISLLPNVLYYNLPNSVVRVLSVSFSVDGSNFTEGTIKPMTLTDMDDMYGGRKWKDVTGTKPTHYTLLGCPGIVGQSKLLLWRPMASVVAEKIRVRYLSCIPDNNLSLLSMSEPEWVQDAVYVPLVMAQMYASGDPRTALEYFAQYQNAAGRVRSLYQNKLTEADWPLSGGTVDQSTGQLS